MHAICDKNKVRKQKYFEILKKYIHYFTSAYLRVQKLNYSILQNDSSHYSDSNVGSEITLKPYLFQCPE